MSYLSLATIAEHNADWTLFIQDLETEVLQEKGMAYAEARLAGTLDEEGSVQLWRIGMVLRDRNLVPNWA